MAKEKPTYTTILHKARKKLGINLLEYCLCDSVHKLSSKPEFPWCSSSKQELAIFLEVSRRSVTGIIKKMIEKGLIEKNPETKFLRSTNKWVNTVETTGRAKSAQGGKKLPTGREKTSLGREKTSHNNNSISKDNKNMPDKPAEWDLKEEIEKYKNDRCRHIQIIGLWITEKGFMPENKEQLDAIKDRNLKPARKLVGYKDEQIKETIKVLKEVDWLRKFTLETVSKFIDEIVSQEKKRGPKIVRWEQIKDKKGQIIKMRPIYARK